MDEAQKAFVEKSIADALAVERAAYRKRELEREEQDAASKMTSKEMVLGCIRQNVNSMDQCQEPANLTQSGTLEQFRFTKEMRVLAEMIANVTDKLEEGTSVDTDVLIASARKMKKLLDLRLASYHGASQASTYKKMDFVADYYGLLKSKVDKTSGKYFEGKKDFAEVDFSLLKTIDERLSKHDRERHGGRGRGHGHGQGFQRGGGGGGGRGAGRRAPAPAQQPAGN